MIFHKSALSVCTSRSGGDHVSASSRWESVSAGTQEDLSSRNVLVPRRVRRARYLKPECRYGIEGFLKTLKLSWITFKAIISMEACFHQLFIYFLRIFIVIVWNKNVNSEIPAEIKIARCTFVITSLKM